MARPANSVWAGAARRLRPGWLLLLIIGNAVLALGALLWLQIPDSHSWQFALSVLLGLLWLVAGLWIFTKAISAARGPERTPPLWIAFAWLMAGAITAFLWMHIVGLLETNTELRAGYWNSQLSAHWRRTLTYPRLVSYQNIAITALIWLLPILLLPIIVELMTRGWGRGVLPAATRVWLRWQFWIVAILTLLSGYKLTALLIDWHPADSVRGEVLSVALRLTLAYGIDILFACVALAVTCELLSQSSLRESARRDPAP
jgi:hypothetical protein